MEIPKTLSVMLGALVWGTIGVPLRLVISWVVALRGVFGGDQGGTRLQASVRKAGEGLCN